MKIKSAYSFLSGILAVTRDFAGYCIGRENNHAGVALVVHPAGVVDHHDGQPVEGLTAVKGIILYRVRYQGYLNGTFRWEYDLLKVFSFEKCVVLNRQHIRTILGGRAFRNNGDVLEIAPFRWCKTHFNNSGFSAVVTNLEEPGNLPEKYYQFFSWEDTPEGTLVPSKKTWHPVTEPPTSSWRVVAKLKDQSLVTAYYVHGVWYDYNDHVPIEVLAWSEED